MTLTIQNRDELAEFFRIHREAGRPVYSRKGAPPPGATYSDGDLILQPVNHSWHCDETGDSVVIRYATPGSD